MFRKIISTSASWTPLPLRLALAAVFIGHGAQKVLGSFGGPGFAKFTNSSTHDFMDLFQSFIIPASSNLLSFEFTLPGELTRKAGTHSVRAWTKLAMPASADALILWIVFS